MNIMVNCLFNIVMFKVNPVNKGYQWTKPAIIANTAPIDRT